MRRLSNLIIELNLDRKKSTPDILSPMWRRLAQPGLGFLVVSAFASGFAALALELLWGRELALTFGSSQYAVAAVLTAFMVGLGVGTAIGGWLADRLRSPALAVAVIELALAGIGPLVSLGLLRLPNAAAKVLPMAVDATSWPFLLGRLAVGVAVLLVPTCLMGAGFPLLARAAARSGPEFHRSIGKLMAAATLGGVAGAAATGFLLLPGGGIPWAVIGAALANIVAGGAAALSLGRIPTTEATPAAASALGRVFNLDAFPLLTAAAVSGAVVLAAETIWHRALLLVIANSTATLTLLLCVTLAGLGLGAGMVTPQLSRPGPLGRWAKLQTVAVALLVGQAMLLPGIADMARLLRPDSGWARVLVPPLAVGGALILPVAVVLGAAWPLLLTAATPRISDGGRRLGAMGIVNSIGAGLGAAATGFVLLPVLGFGKSLLLVAGCHAGLAAAAWDRDSRWIRWCVAGVAAALFAAALLGPRFAAVPLPSVAASEKTDILQYRESPAGTVVVTQDRETGGRSMYVDNNAVIGSSYDALKIVRMLGLVPGLFHPDPHHVLVIGYGAGVTTATIAAVPGIETVTVAEIVPQVVDAARFFEELNHGIHNDPRVELVANDGRNLLLLDGPRFDVITCDPVHPLYGSAPLYSLDYFNLCRRRLARGGIVCQYLPLHRMPTREFRRAIATFGEAFEESWLLFGLGHAMLVGGESAPDLDWQRWRRVIGDFKNPNDLAASSLATPAQIASLLQLDPAACLAVAQGPPSTDLHPHLEFLAPAAYQPGLWQANAQLLVEAYTSPLGSIRGLPRELENELRRLVAGKRLLLFSLLERNEGNAEGTLRWLRQALAVAGDDPEIQHYARQVQGELEGRR